MDAINKDLRKKFIVSITLTIMFVVGIPSIVLGASNEIWVVMAIGIAFTAAGFYGMPIAWVGYGNTKTLERLVSAVVNENLHTVNELASQFSLSEKEVRDKLDVCFKKGYFVGIKRDGDTLILNENDPLGQKQPVLHRLLPHHSLRCSCYGCCKKNVHPHRKRLACRSCKRNDHDLHRLRKHLFERWHGRLVLRSIISLALRAGIRKSTCSFFALLFSATQITLAVAQIHITKRKQTLVSISKTHTDTHRKTLQIFRFLYTVTEKPFRKTKKRQKKGRL